jgi:DNA-binding FrmR family transcriptional regulator
LIIKPVQVKAMTLCGTDQDKERLIKRLRRIEGQVRGLCGMVENDRDCMEVLRQVASVSGALRGVWTQVVGDHLRGCISKAVLDKDSEERLIDELIEHLNKIR